MTFLFYMLYFLLIYYAANNFAVVQYDLKVCVGEFSIEYRYEYLTFGKEKRLWDC